LRPDPDRRAEWASTIIDDINTQIQRYLRLLLVTAIVVDLATWTVLAWIDAACSEASSS